MLSCSFTFTAQLADESWLLCLGTLSRSSLPDGCMPSWLLLPAIIGGRAVECEFKVCKFFLVAILALTLLFRLLITTYWAFAASPVSLWD